MPPLTRQNNRILPTSQRDVQVGTICRGPPGGCRSHNESEGSRGRSPDVHSFNHRYSGTCPQPDALLGVEGPGHGHRPPTQRGLHQKQSARDILRPSSPQDVHQKTGMVSIEWPAWLSTWLVRDPGSSQSLVPSSWRRRCRQAGMPANNGQVTGHQRKGQDHIPRGVTRSPAERLWQDWVCGQGVHLAKSHPEPRGGWQGPGQPDQATKLLRHGAHALRREWRREAGEGRGRDTS